jgi:L-rhamnose mutarotase
MVYRFLPATFVSAAIAAAETLGLPPLKIICPETEKHIMKRHGFTMKLKPGCAAEYRKRHELIWPELKELLAEAGIRDYVIFLDEGTGTLFASQQLPVDFDGGRLAAQPVMQKWWKYMADLMETNPDLSPVTEELQEMFYME